MRKQKTDKQKGEGRERRTGGKEGEKWVWRRDGIERKAKKQKCVWSLSCIDAETIDGEDDVKTDWQGADYLSLNEGD